MATCIRCGGPDAPSETVMCADCFAGYAVAVSLGPLADHVVERLTAFIEEQHGAAPFNRIEIIATRSSLARGTVGEVDAMLGCLGTVRRWNEKTPGRPYTVTVWMRWSPRVTMTDVRELREALRHVLPVFVRARIMAVPRKRR